MLPGCPHCSLPSIFVKGRLRSCLTYLVWVGSSIYGGKFLVFLSSRFVKLRDSSAFSVCIFFEENVFIFQFLNDKMHCYVKHNITVNFIIQKFKNKHIFLKKYTN